MCVCVNGRVPPTITKFPAHVVALWQREKHVQIQLPPIFKGRLLDKTHRHGDAFEFYGFNLIFHLAVNDCGHTAAFGFIFNNSTQPV